MKRLNTSYQNQLDMAKKYWEGNIKFTPDYLFYGEAKVIEIDEIES